MKLKDIRIRAMVVGGRVQPLTRIKPKRWRGIPHLIVAGFFFPAGNVFGGVDDIVQAIASSELRFSRTESDVPFPALGWVKYHHYSTAEFANFEGGPSPGSFRQHEVNFGLVMPVHVAQRDIVLAGLDTSYDRFDFKSSAFHDAEVLTLTPVAGWLRQVNTDSQVVAFVAPMFSSALGDNTHWGTHAFAGLLGTYQATDHLMWIYGGVYEYSFGSHYVYPYLGLNWLPDPRWAVTLVVPWPSVTYAPNKRFFVHLGVAPGGASWRVRDGGEDTVASFGSWNVSAGAGYRFAGHFWLHGEVGMAGLHSLQITSHGKSHLDADINRHPVLTLSVEFRP